MTDIILSKDQQFAADEFLAFILKDGAGEMAIQGHAGVGKSFMTKHLITLANKSKNLIKLVSDIDNALNITLTATTNQAAQVLGELAKKNTSTIHSLLSLKVFNNYNTGKTSLRQTKSFEPIHNTLVIIDEASMVDSQLLTIIRKSCINCKVLFILDAYQLAPIGENHCPVSTDVAHQVVLTTIHRQAKGNPIIDLAEGYRKVLDGAAFPKIQEFLPAIKRVDGPAFQAAVDTEFDSIDHDVTKAKVLTWRNDMVNAYNKHIRGLHTSSDKPQLGEWIVTNKPITDSKKTILYRANAITRITDITEGTLIVRGIECWEVSLGKCNCLIPVNTKDFKSAIKAAARKAKSTKIPDWTEYFSLIDTFADLRPVYASTVHKSQGSTYDKVFINLTDIGLNREPHEVARLMYVAITRAASEIILYGRLGAKYGD